MYGNHPQVNTTETRVHHDAIIHVLTFYLPICMIWRLIAENRKLKVRSVVRTPVDSSDKDMPVWYQQHIPFPISRYRWIMTEISRCFRDRSTDLIRWKVGRVLLLELPPPPPPVFVGCTELMNPSSERMI